MYCLPERFPFFLKEFIFSGFHAVAQKCLLTVSSIFSSFPVGCIQFDCAFEPSLCLAVVVDDVVRIFTLPFCVRREEKRGGTVSAKQVTIPRKLGLGQGSVWLFFFCLDVLGSFSIHRARDRTASP